MAEEKISIPRFNGTDKAFKTWWIKFYFYVQEPKEEKSREEQNSEQRGQ